MFSPSMPIRLLLAHYLQSGPRRRGTLRTMQSAAQYQPQLSGPTLVDATAPPAQQVAGVSAAWRKLLMQADMAAPHVQVAAIEG